MQMFFVSIEIIIVTENALIIKKGAAMERSH